MLFASGIHHTQSLTGKFLLRQDGSSLRTGPTRLIECIAVETSSVRGALHEVKAQLQAISRQWESMIPAMVEAHEERKAWRRLERKSMIQMGLATEMLPASDTEDEMVLDMVSKAKQVREVDEYEEQDKEVGSQLDEEQEDDEPRDEVPNRYTSRPAMFTVSHKMCCERIYRLQRRRYDEEPEKKKKKLDSTLAALAELDAHAASQHVPSPSMAPRVTSASRSSNQPRSPNPQHRPLVPGLLSKEKTKKLAADARGAYVA